MTIATPQPVFTGNHFRIREKSSWYSRLYIVEHRCGSIVAYGRQEPFTLRTGVRLYDETTTTELLYVKQRAVLEWSPEYDVIDSTSGQSLGTIKHNVWTSTTKEWTVADALGQEIGSVGETSARGIFGATQYVLDFGVNQCGIAKPTLTPFARRLTLDISAIPPEKFDRRLAIAFGIVVIAP